MPKGHRFFTLTFTYIVFVVFVSTPAFPVDSGTYWLLVDATLDRQARNGLNSLAELLTTRGKVPSAQIYRVEGENATNAEIHAQLQEIGRQVTTQDTLIFLYHGIVTKPRGTAAMHLLPQGDGDIIEDSTLNGWLRETGTAHTVVIMDAYTEDTNLNAYFGNREILGTAALNVIQSVSKAERTTLLKKLNDALAVDTTDLDENRQLSISEVYDLLAAQELLNGILAPTGNVEAALLKLSPALKVTTLPEGAQVSINDVEVGRTPKRITENLQQGTSKVSVKKAGYITPPPKPAELALVLGESVHIGWVLKPIAIHGTVKGVDNASPAGAIVWIDGTTHRRTVAPDGIFRFDEWSPPDLLTIGETYTLYAKHGSLNYDSVTFTFDGYSDISQSLQLINKNWFEVSQIEFDRDNHQGAVTAFQNGVEETTDFPQMSTDLTVLLLSSFADALEKQDVQDVTYLVVTAKLAERLNQLDLAEKYWQEVKTKAQKGTPAAKLAGQRLWKLNRGRYLLNIGLIVLLAVLLVSGAWTFYRYRKTKQVAQED